MQAGRAVCVALLVAACSDTNNKPKDAAIDSPVDTPADTPPDASHCGAELFFTGAYVDWDDDATFCGIFGATFTVHGDAARTASTAPNGRFLLCLAQAAITQVDITPPTMTSQCTIPLAGYTLPGIAIANQAVIDAGGDFGGRSWTTARQTTFFQLMGQVFDPTKAQVIVHVDGTPRAVSLAATHGASWAVAATAWAAGDTGHDVFFPNVDVGAGTTTVSVAGGAIGTGSIPLVAGTMTNITVVAN